MKRLCFIMMLLMLVVQAKAQQSEVRNVGSFTGIRTSEGIDVYLKKGDRESVRVETSGELSDVITEVSGTSLKIHRRESNFRKNANVKVYVTYTSLDNISASSASNVFSDEAVKSARLEVDASSAASIEITIEVNDLEVDVSSAADVDLKGRAKRAEVDASSAGQVDAYGLQAESLSAEASSAGSIKISVGNELDARASSGGSIRYRGSPAKSRTDSSSGGSVKKAD